MSVEIIDANRSFKVTYPSNAITEYQPDQMQNKIKTLLIAWLTTKYIVQAAEANVEYVAAQHPITAVLFKTLSASDWWENIDAREDAAEKQAIAAAQVVLAETDFAQADYELLEHLYPGTWMMYSNLITPYNSEELRDPTQEADIAGYIQRVTDGWYGNPDWACRNNNGVLEVLPVVKLPELP